MLRALALSAAVMVTFTGCETVDIFLAPDPAPVVYVREPVYRRDFDPYYNRPKVFWGPEEYHETTTKKTKGNNVFKTTTVKNQYGDTVYKHTSEEKKKKKKKKK